MFELLRLFIALVGSAIAGLWDLKTTDIPDKVAVAMIVSGIALHIIEGLLTGNYLNLLYSLGFGGLFLLFGLLMYYSGQWGGGDGEMLVAMVVLMPVYPVATLFPFAITFFINMIFVGAIYSIIYSIILTYNNPKVVKTFFKNINTRFSRISILLLALLSVVTFFYFNRIVFLTSLTLLGLFVFQRFAKAIESGFYKTIPVSKLKVDDMIGEDIPRLKIYKRLLRGLTEEEVKMIKKFKKTVVVREGVRYGPVFFLTLVFTLLFGDFVLLIL